MTPDRKLPFGFDVAKYNDYARKMDQFMYGPTTTYFDQLVADGIELPDPSSLDDVAVRRKLWEVIAGLAHRRVFLYFTNHLTDRELYATLRTEHLKRETPAIDEIGFETGIDIVTCVDEDNGELYFKHYANERFRQSCLAQEPSLQLPEHEDPPYTRDAILPRAKCDRASEARAWLAANPLPSAFATNRFQETKHALAFVEALYAAGAPRVTIDNVQLLPNKDWLPYADALMVSLPEDPGVRQKIFDLIENVGRPDEDAGERPYDDGGQVVRLWWD